MSLFKIIAIIVVVWLILQIKRFISGIQITSGKLKGQKTKQSRKTSMNVQDADYEDVK